MSTLQNKLLKGDPFFGIEQIGGLEDLLQLLSSGATGMEYQPHSVFSESDDRISERTVLEDRRRRDVQALGRLRSLYLYGDETMAEKDFIIERHNIEKDIEEIDNQLLSMGDLGGGTDNSSDEFIEKASYFIMVDKLLDDGNIDYEKYIRSIDPTIPRSFVKSVIQSIEVTDGKVTAISFVNGITNRFKYK